MKTVENCSRIYLFIKAYLILVLKDGVYYFTGKNLKYRLLNASMLVASVKQFKQHYSYG